MSEDVRAALRREMDGYLRRGLTDRANEVAAQLRNLGDDVENAVVSKRPAARRGAGKA